MIGERLTKIILSNIVSEKSAIGTESIRQYVFKVLPDANKLEISLAVEKMFNVQVQCVRVLNVKGKIKKVGAKIGRRKNWRKAYVRLKEGHEINFGSA
jgi:large subunit ribosomal protein L23